MIVYYLAYVIRGVSKKKYPHYGCIKRLHQTVMVRIVFPILLSVNQRISTYVNTCKPTRSGPGLVGPRICGPRIGGPRFSEPKLGGPTMDAVLTGSAYQSLVKVLRNLEIIFTRK